MKVNHNISAMISSDNLLRNEGLLANSVERLSSGYKINHAKDHPSGMAISIKMRAQIRGLDQAETNADSGNSVLETADGAMGEMSSILQRMRELSVQAASATTTPSDRAIIQEEIDSLTEEITRISEDTEFNSLSLLNGDLNTHTYTNSNYATVFDTNRVNEGKYQILVTSDATQASVTTGTTTAVSEEGVLNINGIETTISTSDSSEEVWVKLQEMAAYAGVSITSSTTTFTLGSSALTITSDEYGNDIDLNISTSNNALAASLGLNSIGGWDSTTNEMATVHGSDIVLSISGATTDNEFTGSEAIYTQGQRVRILGDDGFEIRMVLTDGAAADSTTNGGITLNVTGMGSMYLQIGANENQGIEVEIPNLSAYALGIEGLNIQNEQGADRAIGLLDDALEYLNATRAALGAYENRLDHTIANLDATEENMERAISRIMDVDMAEEMTLYSNLNILTQAGTSVLAQANELPEQALQMLR